MALVQCTFSGNSGTHSGGGVYSDFGRGLTLDRTIISFSVSGQGLDADDHVTLTCCDIYGNAGGDWIQYIANQLGMNGNICEDPLFCHPENLDFTLHADSPCAPFTPPNPECDLIGAWPVGCGSTPTVATTWGQIKTLFQQ